MEKGEMAMKIEDGNNGSYSFPGYNPNSYPFSSVFDFSEVEKSSLGFMEILGMQDFNPLLDFPQELSSMVVGSPAPKDPTDQGSVKKNCVDEVLNYQQQQPATPNSSSISLASSEGGINDEQTKTTANQQVEDDEQQQNTKKHLKPKKTNQKKQREPRIAFMTKSKVDHLEDGYRWRKYGQKAVKNSSFPRSYYRCTSAPCNVKKLIERSFNDPSIVVTTYEGQHTHPSPLVMPRRTNLAGVSGGAISARCATTFASSIPRNLYQYQHAYHQQQPFDLNNTNTLSSLNFHYNHNGSSSISRMSNSAFLHFNQGTTFLSDHGLLQDIVPSQMLKEEQH
ncbi:WRKY transcription factor [Quillaja saponaria]|uniref:WRKY transcription factor n=1 Tax=Quillaja saponaria TaxID=32244 RepID=A0AAD7Q1K2_QUISA|nr:WRKY transcription factor [Quillaja saponaria]